MTETLSPTLPDDIESLTHELLKLACDREVTIATAESCTGGLLASLLTDVEGAGHVFERGFVTYSEDAKCELLGLSQAMIDDCGAVSEDVARAMAEGALANSHADLALAITGFAGAAGADGEPGLVHFACARAGRITAHREEHFGAVGRGAVRVAALEVAIAMMTEML